MLHRALTRTTAVDAAFAGALAATAEVELLATDVAGPRAVAVAIALLMTLPLALRRTRPLAAVLAVAVSFPLFRLAGVDLYDYLASVIAGLAAAYTATAQLRPRVALPALACTYAAIALAALRGPSGLVWGAILIGGAGLAGFGIRDRRLRADALAALARELAAARDANARAAVAAERSRIARELHDVVTHSVSVMVVQAGAAEQVLPPGGDASREALQAIQATGRQALAELRRLLGVLRTEDTAAATLGPQPGLGEIEVLAESVRQAGTPVDLHVEGEPSKLPAGLDLAAFRIVQEALTNVLNHAPGAATRLTIAFRPDALEVAVVNPVGGNGLNGTNGHGVVGMRERARLYGGTLEAGLEPAGTFAVRARLPLEGP